MEEHKSIDLYFRSCAVTSLVKFKVSKKPAFIAPLKFYIDYITY